MGKARENVVTFGKIIMTSLSILLLHGTKDIQGTLLSKYQHNQKANSATITFKAANITKVPCKSISTEISE